MERKKKCKSDFMISRDVLAKFYGERTNRFNEFLRQLKSKERKKEKGRKKNFDDEREESRN